MKIVEQWLKNLERGLEDEEVSEQDQKQDPFFTSNNEEATESVANGNIDREIVATVEQLEMLAQEYDVDYSKITNSSWFTSVVTMLGWDGQAYMFLVSRGAAPESIKIKWTIVSMI